MAVDFNALTAIMMAPLLAVDDPSIERLTAASPQLAETILCAARGFSGSSDVPPEGAMDWCLGVDYRAPGEKIVLGEPLGPAPPPADRRGYFTYVCRSMFVPALRHGGCFALKDDDGVVVAAAVGFPPSSTGSVRDDEEEEDDESDPGLTLGPEQLGPPPRNKMTEGAGRRFGLFGPLMEALEEQALPPGTPHWYVLCFSVSPTAQGRGYGARLLRWLGRCADHNNVPILLETCGDRNRRFYEGSGFELGAAVCFVQNQNSKLRSADARKVLLNNY